MLDVPRGLIGFVSALLHAERRARGTVSGSRALSCWKQALFAVSWFRDRPNIARHGAAFGISQATAYRYLHEAIDVLADAAPTIHEALGNAAADGLAHLILDGKIFDAAACRIKTTSVKGEQIDLWYSGKTSGFGGNVQALLSPRGIPLWVSDVEPGSTHDIDAARTHVFPAAYAATKTTPILAEPGYQGAGHGIHIPVKNPDDGTELHPDIRTRNTLLRGLRCLGERGFSILTNRWTALQKTTLAPSRIGDIVKAALVLTHFEYHMIK
jgi:hypothetical protein